MEVRLLRQALERSATAPQVQILGTRLTVQNDRLQSAIRDHEAARAALQELTSAAAAATEKLAALADDLGGNLDPAHRAQYADMQTGTKAHLSELTRREPQLRARESELAALVAAEQNQWLLLNRRLDEIERGLPR